MPLLQINAENDRPQLAGAMSLTRALALQLAALPAGAPIVVLLHGYKFSPFHSGHDPHRNILSLAPPERPGLVSWPRHLGFGQNRSGEGLCIGFGWQARGSIWRAYREAERAGLALARLLQVIAGLSDRPVHLIGHSLGARVALAGIAAARHGHVGRVILMAAAEFQGPAARSLSSPVGRGAEFFNISSRENDLYDLIVEALIDPLNRHSRALGAGFSGGIENWLDLQIDQEATRRALAGFGYRLAPPIRQICHRSVYLRPGLLRFYGELIRRPDDLPMRLLRNALPATRDRRWSRLLARRDAGSPLPFAPKPAF